MPSTSYIKINNKINYSPPSHKMQRTMWDPLTTNTTLCGTTLRNIKISTLLLHYPRRHVLTHPQTNKSGRKDLLPSTPLTGTALGLPSATTFFNTRSHPTTRKVHKTLLNSFQNERTSFYRHNHYTPFVYDPIYTRRTKK